MMKRSFYSAAGNVAFFLLITFSLVTLYILCSSLWVNIGGINFDDSHIILFEPFFVGVFSMIFFVRRTKNKVGRYIFPVIPVVIFYISFDIFYSFLRRAPHPSDLKNIYTIFDFSPSLGVFSFALLLIIPAMTFYLLIKSAKMYSSIEIVSSLIMKITFMTILLLSFSSRIFITNYTEIFDYIDWSQERTIRNNGRFSSFIYYWMQERKNKNVLNNFSKNFLEKNIDIDQVLYPNTATIKNRNIYIVVLESFLDPRLIKNASFNISPLSRELVPFMLDGEKFSLVTSPVYGGRTAQAEFEILSGVQALSKIDSIEFNVMMGKPASSFVKRLADSNYQTIATIASSSEYFNSKQAYRSLGFDQVTFLKDIDKFRDPKWMPIFDGDVFQYNLSLIEEAIKKREKPIVNYILGMYGHFPYEADRDRHPDIIDATHEDDRVKKIANQFFYRTKAVSEYIKKIISIDPESIIYITSDHLPPILWDGTQYELDQQTNIAILIDAGKQVDVSGKKYFQIPWIIWDILTEENHSRQIDPLMMENLYFKFLSESICK